jgi:hypothetical protein
LHELGLWIESQVKNPIYSQASCINLR